jgi:hypothetical protein
VRQRPDIGAAEDTDGTGGIVEKIGGELHRSIPSQTPDKWHLYLSNCVQMWINGGIMWPVDDAGMGATRGRSCR